MTHDFHTMKAQNKTRVPSQNIQTHNYDHFIE